MIRFSARGAYSLQLPQGRALIRNTTLIRGRALISPSRNSRICNKASMFICKGLKITERTVHSHGHNSQETETRRTVLSRGNERKMNQGWSQCTCTLTVLSLKRNRGPYWSRGAYWNEGAYSIGALSRKGALFKQKEFEGGAFWNEGAKLNHYRFISFNSSTKAALQFPYKYAPLIHY